MSRSVPEASLRQIGAASRSRPRRAGLGRWAILALTAVAAAAVAITATATQLTQRETAETLLARVGRSLLELDALTAVAWDDLAAAAAAGEALSLPDFPLELQINAADLAGGPAALADAVSLRLAQTLYGEGFDALLEEPRGVGDFFSDVSVFSGTIGRITAGGRTLATIALIVSLCAFVPLALGALTQARGARRLLDPGAALGIGGLLALVVGIVAESRFATLADANPDPLMFELYAVGVDVSALLIRNAGIIAILGAALVGIAIVAAQFEQRS